LATLACLSHTSYIQKKKDFEPLLSQQRKPSTSIDNLSTEQEESSLTLTFTSSFTSTHQIIESSPVMSEDDDIAELKELHYKTLQLQTRFLSKIPIFKSPRESNINKFLSKVEDIFNVLKYSDDIRLTKIADKLDESLQFWFKNF
jgi:hypothetical protein